MKHCKVCKNKKSLSDFYSNKSHADGLAHNCKTCYKAAYALKRAKPKTIPTEKLCNKCSTVKPASEFHRNVGNIDGLRPRCKVCHNQDNVDFGRSTRYGISIDTYRSMIEKQSNKCSICKTEFTSKGKFRANVDHDHQSGAVRELLCQNCNLGLGAFADNVDTLLEAIRYLRKHNITQTFQPSYERVERDRGF